MNRFYKQLLYIVIGVAVLTAGAWSIWAVSNRGAAPVAWWKFDEGYGTTAYDAAGSNDGTMTYMSTSTNGAWGNEEECKSGKCLSFDGVDGYVSMGDPADGSLDFGTGDFSVSAWVKRNGDFTGYYIAKGVNAANKFYGIYLSNGKVYAVISDAAGSPQYVNIVSSTTLSDNVWYHVTAVYDRDGNGQIYINGIPDGSAVDISGEGDISNVNILAIGKQSSSDSFYFNGYIDDVRIYDYARSAGQIKADYVAGAGGRGGSMRVASSQEQNDQSEGLVAHWTFDETALNACGTATDACDTSGGANNLAAIADASPTSTAKYGYAATFDGTGDYYCTDTNDDGACEDDDDLDINGNFTSEIWVQFSSFGSEWRNYTISHGSGEQGVGFYVRIWDTGAVQFLTGNGAGFYNSVGTRVGLISIDTWYHIVAVVDDLSKEMRIYVNGKQEGNLGYSTLNMIPPSGHHFKIGSSNGGINGLDGQIDDVKIYNKARSASQIRKDYETGPPPVAHWRMDENSGTSAQDTAGTNTGTLTNSPIWTQGKYGSALQFDGDDYVDCNGATKLDFATTSFSFGAWMKSTTIGNKATYDGIIGKKNGAENSYYGLIVFPNQQLSFELRDNDVNYDFSKVSSGVNDGEWHHIFGSVDRNTGTAYLYLDGVQVSTKDISAMNAVSNTGDLWIAKYAGSNGSGYVIDDVRIYNYARTQKQIMEDMNAGHPAVGSPIGSYVGYWKFDEMSGSTAYDQSINANNGTLMGEMATSTASASGWNNKGKFASALAFEGTDDYVDIGDLNTNVQTISFWVYPETTTEYFIDINGTAYISSSAGVLSATGFTSPTIYVNGKELNSFQADQWQHVVVVTNTGIDANDLDIARIEGTGYLEGKIDEVKIYPFALTAEEVRQEYNRGGTLQLGSVSTESDGTTASHAASREYCVPGDTSTCRPPVAHWKFDEKEGLTAYDTSTSSNNGTLTSGPTWQHAGNCHSGSCLSFDGTNDYVSAGSPSLPFTGDITISVWFYYVNSPISQSIITQGGANQGPYKNFRLTAGSNGNRNLSFQVQNSASTYFYSSNSNSLNLNAYNHIVVVNLYNNEITTHKYYVNGQLIYTGTKAVQGLGNSAGKELLIGAYKDSSTLFNYNAGLIDDVRIYNYARTPAQIAWEYNRGAPIGWWKMDEGQDSETTCDATRDTVYDYSGKGNNGHLNNANASPATSTMWTTGKYSCALDFDGVDDYVSIGAINNTMNGATLSLWAYSTQVASYYFIDHESPRFALYTNSSQAIDFYHDGAKSTNYNPPENEWFHITLTIDDTPSDGYMRLYINGVLENEQDTNIASSDLFSGTLYIGARYNVDTPFNGLIDDVRIYNYALTPTQIRNVFNQGSSVRFGPASGLP